jgi:ABC-type molybdate transport system substrate-binding protein
LSGAPFTRITIRAVCDTGLIFAAAVIMMGRALGGSAQSTGQLNVCHAGSVQLAFSQVEKTFTAQHPDVVLKDISGGSIGLAGRLAAGLQPCDVYAAADYQDIDLLLKPAGLADYTIVFAKGRMVLAYLTTDPKTHGVAGAGEFMPPTSVPNAAPEWYQVLLAPGVRIASSHPFLDPGGYRAHMIFHMAQTHYNVPNLSNLLLEHLTINAAADANADNRPALGRDYNFQFTYEHSAAAAATSNPSYRYVTLPDRIDLSTSNNSYYARVSMTIPAIGPPGGTASISIPAARVAWGLTILNKSPNSEHAIAFVNLVLGAAGAAALKAHGPAPITPALVSPSDYARLPKSMQSLVTAGPILP